MKHLLLIAFLGTMLTACKIPLSWRGSYESADHRSSLTMKKSKIALSLNDGAFEIAAKAKTPSLKDLTSGAGGAFVERVKEGELGTIVEGTVIEPTSAAMAVDGGIVFFSAKIAYFTMSLAKDASKTALEVMYCLKGQVTVDVVGDQWQAGCDEHEESNVTLVKLR